MGAINGILMGVYAVVHVVAPKFFTMEFYVGFIGK